MKFLPKDPQSSILLDGLTHKVGNNRTLCQRLLQEQKQFCAYTEKYITDSESVEVEHFDASKKWNDDYFNYYAAIRKANLSKLKKDKPFAGASFFQSLFFHDQVQFNNRIEYTDGEYIPVNQADREAQQLIDYLPVNDEWLYSERANHIDLLRETLNDANYSKEEQRAYLIRHRKMASFITAIEKEFNLDLSELYR